MAPVKSSPKTKSGGKSSVREFPRTLNGSVPPKEDGNRAEALNAYQQAVTLMQQGKYSEAHPALEQLLQIAPPEFTDRVRMYLSACIAQRDKDKTTFQSPEEKYDFAISLLNDGQYEDARQHLNEILNDHGEADYALYGLAVLASMTGDSQTCLEKLTRAIELNHANRIQARSDSDFQDMADDPRFTELLYPES